MLSEASDTPSGTQPRSTHRPRRYSRLAVIVAAAAITALTGCVPSPSPPGSPSAEHWFAIGRCEQPGDGLGGVDWTIHGPGYEGGLGFAVGTWEQFRDPGFPVNAGDATPGQQIWVANQLWALYGPDPWGCKTDVP